MGVCTGAIAAALLILGGASPAGATDAIDWSRYADVETVQVITTNPDGSQRETTVWLVVVEGEGFLRTGGTRWGDNVERQPAIAIRVGEVEHPLRVEFVTDPPLREKVTAAFRAKYGFFDRILGVFRGRSPRLMRLLPRGEH